jgi:hypothetical protein
VKILNPQKNNNSPNQKNSNPSLRKRLSKVNLLKRKQRDRVSLEKKKRNSHLSLRKVVNRGTPKRRLRRKMVKMMNRRNNSSSSKHQSPPIQNPQERELRL